MHYGDGYAVVRLRKLRQSCTVICEVISRKSCCCLYRLTTMDIIEDKHGYLACW